MDIKEALIMGAKKIRTKKILADSASLDADVLLSFVLKKPKEYIFAYPEKKLNKQQEIQFKKCIQKRLRYTPIAYIVGVKEFYGRDFKVNKNVLIPRPETESLVEKILNHCYNLEPITYNLSIADIGTGSGCIAITLAKELKNATVYATDISAQALVVAKKNAKIHKTKIKFFKGNLLEPIQNKKIDIVIANLPYLDFNDKNEYKKILSHEPRRTLYAKNNGLEYYHKLFQQISENKIYPRIIAFEILPKQRKNLKKLTKKLLPNYSIKFLDYTALLTKNS